MNRFRCLAVNSKKRQPGLTLRCSDETRGPAGRRSLHASCSPDGVATASATASVLRALLNSYESRYE